jgi:hypothetical protein
MDDIFTIDLNAHIDSVYPDASGRLDRIDELPDSAGKRIVNTLLEAACQSQHIGKILAARKALLRLPGPWLARVLHDAIEEVVDLKDEWEYRRLMELLKWPGLMAMANRSPVPTPFRQESEYRLPFESDPGRPEKRNDTDFRPGKEKRHRFSPESDPGRPEKKNDTDFRPKSF